MGTRRNVRTRRQRRARKLGPTPLGDLRAATRRTTSSFTFSRIGNAERMRSTKPPVCPKAAAPAYYIRWRGRKHGTDLPCRATCCRDSSLLMLPSRRLQADVTPQAVRHGVKRFGRDFSIIFEMHLSAARFMRVYGCRRNLIDPNRMLGPAAQATSARIR